MTIAISVLIALLVGWYSREIIERIKILQQQVTALVKRDIPIPEQRKSLVAELPLTPSERIKRDQEELLERLNSDA
jgi:hypothetical protein